MSNSQPLMRARSSIGDAAVDGLLNGVVAGVVMAIYLIVVGVLTGTGMAATLSAFDLGQGTSPVRGALIHLALAAIYGMAYGLIQRLIGRGRSIGRGGNVIIGLAYGLLLWLITQIAFAAGINVALSSLPTVQLAVAHVIYGTALGWLTGRARTE
ncbi:MAG: hypothetical protein HGB05_00915 [Chloroflexi bacterium]|nr:hypothetical protein [Chloroflexota bacterium]